MTDQNKKDVGQKTDASYVDVFDKLMTIGSTVKELTEEVLQLAAEKDKTDRGGDGSATENT